MEKIIRSVISKEAPENIVKELIKYYEIIKTESNNFDNLVDDEKIKLNYKTENIFYEFLFLFNETFPYVDSKKIEEEINKKLYDKEATFFKIVLEYIEFNNIVKNETNFLRELNSDEFEDLVEYAFNNYILYNGTINSYKKWNIGEINILRKTLNTILSNMIDDFENPSTAFLETRMKFDFTQQQFNFIWSLCEKNKIFLMLKNITEKLEK